MFKFLAYLRYFLYCVNEHSLHSPFTFDIYTKIIKDSKKQSPDQSIENLRKILLSSKDTFRLKDFGTKEDREVKVSDLAKKSLSPAYKSIILRDLIEFMESP